VPVQSPLPAALPRALTIHCETEPFCVEGWCEDRVPWLYIDGPDLLFIGSGGSNHGSLYAACEQWLDERGLAWQWDHDASCLAIEGLGVGLADQGIAWLSQELLEPQSGLRRFPLAALIRLRAAFGAWPLADLLDGPVTLV